ncbi:hypothetical protein J1605_014182 [Eschrichtius robustus]|uniref:Secreted protein n=1 Tax=Eschrichtius robustus TaxID=9764 RepID=A0AB34GHG4_ESCRO|nr:hypothetical protein J1605_014182 [Eschrichtius robustus]
MPLIPHLVGQLCLSSIPRLQRSVFSVLPSRGMDAKTAAPYHGSENDLQHWHTGGRSNGSTYFGNQHHSFRNHGWIGVTHTSSHEYNCYHDNALTFIPCYSSDHLKHPGW